MEHWTPLCRGSGASICILCSPLVVGFKSVFPSCMFTLVTFLISFVPFSPRPPCLPPKPQKMRRPRPLSVCNHKLFNGCMEAFIKVLVGSRRVRECAQCNGSLSPPPPLGQQPCPHLPELSICALGQALWRTSSSLQPALSFSEGF